MRTDFRKWRAFGTGIGVEISGARSQDLRVTIARVRPNGIAVLGSATVTDFESRAAAEWGAELTRFFRSVGAAHIAAAVTLPRRDVIVRQVAMPGVSDKDLTSAIGLQLDTLHPYGDEPVVHAHARIGKTPFVLVGITRLEVITRFANLFTEAGIKVASFTFSAAAIYTALRMYSEPEASFAATRETEAGELEIYGESESRPVFSATFDEPSPRALQAAISELRLPADTAIAPIPEILPKPVVFPENHQPGSPEFAGNALPYATALAAACPWQGMAGNLLPVEMRRTSSRLLYVPTIILAVILAGMGIALALYSSYEDRQYLALLQNELRRYEPSARKVQSIDRSISSVRQRTQLLDEFRLRSKADMDAMGELTRLLPPPTWVNAMEIRRDGVQLNGETEQAAELIKVIDNSPLFENTEFTMPYSRGGVGEIFGIRARRQSAPGVPANGQAGSNAVTSGIPASPAPPLTPPVIGGNGIVATQAARP
jgi:Tfp pilus assembly protein PilN